MYNVRPTSRFEKDLRRAKRRGRDMSLLTGVVKKPAAGEPLPEKHRDHALSGGYSGRGERRIAPDRPPIRVPDGNDLILYLTRTGTHSGLFQRRRKKTPATPCGKAFYGAFRTAARGVFPPVRAATAGRSAEKAGAALPTD